MLFQIKTCVFKNPSKYLVGIINTQSGCIQILKCFLKVRGVLVFSAHHQDFPRSKYKLKNRSWGLDSGSEDNGTSPDGS